MECTTRFSLSLGVVRSGKRLVLPTYVFLHQSILLHRCLGTKNILVTGAGGSAGNNVCWSLRVSPNGKDLTLTGTDTERTSIELNRWIDNAYQVPRADDSRYLTIINKIVQSKHVEGLFPQPDSEVRKIAEAGDRLLAKTFLPDLNTVSKCLDKHASLVQWHNAGMRGQTELVSMRNGDLSTQMEQLRFPCWVRAREGAGGLMSCLAKDPKTLEFWIRFHWVQGITTDFVVEEYLPGRDYCFMSIWKDGRMVTSMVRERLTWVGNRSIGTGGTSKLNHIVHSDTVNRNATDAILAVTTKPHGVLCVDLKEDNRGVPRPTEINCRFTTNVHYLTLASVKFGKPEWNFPWLAAKLMLAEQIPACEEYDALPDNLWFTKNVDMGYTMVQDDSWRAAVVK